MLCPLFLNAQKAKVSVVFATGVYRTVPIVYADAFSTNEVLSLARPAAGFGVGAQLPVSKLKRNWQLGVSGQATFGYMLGHEQFQHFPISSFKFTRHVVQAPVILTFNKPLFKKKGMASKHTLVLGAGFHAIYHIRPLGFDRRRKSLQEGNNLLVMPAAQLGYRLRLNSGRLIELSLFQSLGSETFADRRINRSGSSLAFSVYLNDK
ncbi:MAG: hypothetical protein C0424_05990 [Sphingobacteriaceae bacterium]|nr:hypothetical protein [Sphingobacteriaceae bacterium]